MLSFLEIYWADFEIGCLQIESVGGFSAASSAATSVEHELLNWSHCLKSLKSLSSWIEQSLATSVPFTVKSTRAGIMPSLMASVQTSALWEHTARRITATCSRSLRLPMSR
ncbi:unnamed protein product [Urochloa humidicola]